MEPRDRNLLLQILYREIALKTQQHAPYRLYPRKTRRNGRGGKPVSIYYCAKWNTERRCWDTARSTGQTTRAAAETWALRYATDDDTPFLSIKAFATGIFDADSAYLNYRAERGRAMSWNHRTHCAAYLRNYILPYFGTASLYELNTLAIDRFQSWLVQQPLRQGTGTLSPATANHVVQALRLIVKWAIRQRKLDHDPFIGVESLATRPRRRGVFEAHELERIFSTDSSGWPDPAARALNMLAACSGLRKGELQGLRRQCVQEITTTEGQKAAILTVNAAWERSGNLKSTKNGKDRRAPVPPSVYAALQPVMNNSPWQEPEHFVFYSARPDRPVSHKKIDTDFARALDAADITKTVRLQRNLSFHSWRHTTNSILINRGLPPLRAQQIIGHSSLQMTATYLHPGEDFSDVMEITNGIF